MSLNRFQLMLLAFLVGVSAGWVSYRFIDLFFKD